MKHSKQIIFKKLRDMSSELYKSEETSPVLLENRIKGILNKYESLFDSEPNAFISTPGRVELGGNHTDHNGGRVLAAAINLDMIAIGGINHSRKVVVHSDGFPEPFVVDLDDKGPFDYERSTTTSLIRGIGTRLEDMGHTTRGFDAFIQSDIPMHAGLSSSAAVEILIGMMFNVLFNDASIPGERLAMVSQFAENAYYGKPCGLMDQMTCMLGGIIQMDFRDSSIPHINRIDFNLKRNQYSLIVVDTGDSEVSLRDEYKSIPDEMRIVARQFGYSTCRDINRIDIISNINELRKRTGDRALIRALHFIDENDRVYVQTKALGRGDFEYFLKLVNESGDSSYKWLQNVYSSANSKSQGIALALAITQDFLEQIKTGACRVHGGGFAGTILSILPNDKINDYISLVAPVFGREKIYVQDIRNQGTSYLKL